MYEVFGQHAGGLRDLEPARQLEFATTICGPDRSRDRVVSSCGLSSVPASWRFQVQQTEHFDRWDADGVHFHFGYDAKKNLKAIADNLKKSCWKKLERRSKYQVKTKPRRRPHNVKEEVVRQREYENQVLQYEEVAEFDYRPTACTKTYRMIGQEKGTRHFSSP